MDLERARYLVSEEGRRALASLPAAMETLSPNALARTLRREHRPAEASALGEQVTLRRRARERFGEETRLLLTPTGLEMMTHPVVAARRAARLAASGLAVADLTCSIGGDLRAIAPAVSLAVAVDIDPVAALLAAANVPRAHVVCGDATRPPVDLVRIAVMLDPSRRQGVRRARDPAAYAPPLDACIEIARAAALGVVKAPPGISERDQPPGAEIEFVQLGRSLREAALWFGRGTLPGLRRAVLLPGGHELRSDDPEAGSETVAPQNFVFDPEGCVTRAGLVRHLAARLGARMMDPQVAYLTGDEPASHPMAATFEVLEVLQFSVARVRRRLRERGWRADEIRRRAFPVEPDEFRRLLGKSEGDPVTLLCTTLAGRRTVIVGRRVDRAGVGA